MIYNNKHKDIIEDDGERTELFSPNTSIEMYITYRGVVLCTYLITGRVFGYNFLNLLHVVFVKIKGSTCVVLWRINMLIDKEREVER